MVSDCLTDGKTSIYKISMEQGATTGQTALFMKSNNYNKVIQNY